MKNFIETGFDCKKSEPHHDITYEVIEVMFLRHMQIDDNSKLVSSIPCDN